MRYLKHINVNIKIMKFKIALFLTVVFALQSCKKDTKINVTPADYEASIDQVTQVLIHDIFSPPVASRIYAYPNIAAYEVMAQNSTTYESLQHQLNGLDSIPVLDSKSGVNQPLAALVAHMEVSKALVFSEDIIAHFRDSLYQKWEAQNPKEFEVSKKYGLEVAERIKKWFAKDNYKQTRTMPKYSVFTSQPGRWQPTPPAYMDGIEPHWGKIRTFVLDSASQFKPAPALLYSTQKHPRFLNKYKKYMTSR